MAIYAALQLALLILSANGTGRLTALFVASGVLRFIAALCMIPLSWMEHSSSPRPSILLNIYLFLTILFDIIQARSLWLAMTTIDDRRFVCVFTAVTAVKAVMIVAESQRKSKRPQWNTKDRSPEEMSGFYGLGTFSWLNTLVMKGYKNVLTLDDLFTLDQAMGSEALGNHLENHLATHPTPGRKYDLVKGLARVLILPLLLPIVPRLALLVFGFCQPFLIHSVLFYLELPVNERSSNTGYGLICAAAVIYCGMAVSTALYNYFHERVLWKVRGALVTAIYKQTTRSKISTTDDHEAITLMSTDIERIRFGLRAFHEFWVSILQISLASLLLSRELGAAFVAPIIVVAVCAVFITALSQLSSKMQKDWMEQTQNRVAATSNMLAHIKHLKISGMTKPVETLMQKLRVEEIKAGSKWWMIETVSTVISFTPYTIGPVVAFTFTAHSLNATRIFTSVSYLLLLTEPLSQIFQLVPALLSAFACLDRIQGFLEKDPREDFRQSGGSRQVGQEDGEDTKEESAAIVKVSKGSFGWEEGEMHLKNLDFELFPGLTMVVGPIASGKSTLCKVLLGETPVCGGLLTIGLASRRIGYCDQVPFLTNATIKENIIGHAPVNSARYHETVEATMLLPDIANLPLGDGTIVGSNGIALSGGQRQRISMARALYLESDLLIFDDVLSSLDADTEDQVFRRVFGPDGLIHRRNATALLCTNSKRHLPAANHIIALDAGGSQVGQGTFQDLFVNGNRVPSILAQPATQDSRGITGHTSAASFGPEGVDTTVQRQTREFASACSTYVNRQVGDSSIYKHYAKSMGLPALTAFILLGMLTGFLFNFPQIWLNYWSEDVNAPRRVHVESYWIGLYALLQILCLICVGATCVVIFISINRESGTALHHLALRTAINAQLRFFAETDVGIITNLFSQDLTLIDTELPESLFNVVVEAFICIGMVAIVATSSPYMALCYPFLAVALWAIQRLYLRTSRQLRLLDLETKSPLYTHFTDTINGLVTLRAFGWVDHYLQVNNQLLDDSQRPAYLLAMAQHWLTFVLNLLVAIIAIVVVVLSTQIKSIASVGFTGASLVTLMSFGESISLLITYYTLLETSIGAVSRLKSFSENVPSESLSRDDILPPQMWPHSGGIEIRGVSASYAGPIENKAEGGPESMDLALKDLNISISPGEKVAICGRSGSGKSSFILLLLRLVDQVPSCAGNVTIDGLLLNRMDRPSLRQRIIAVPQDCVFLPGNSSFKANLDPFEESTDIECREVLEMVDLWRIAEQRGGLHKDVRAATLSQGQRQLFSLSRAIMRRRIRGRQVNALLHDSENNNSITASNIPGNDDTPRIDNTSGGILLLDEVSSSVDKDTHLAMQAVIRREFAEYTIVMVSHRLDVIMDYDKVLIMDSGSIIEHGRPHDLVNQEGSSFSKLWATGGHWV
ncbi:Uncharacterized protein TCAP_06269 [Tolypocladium capitatum]|uniref:ABC transporter n=1 Tax=Tolypocladium capitatum TaxID=45235 RepID=A0A2K3Q8D7_9HYPO|nr:Uncharacterized protein TCAP_06269 [Tolypocladium capitatum]